MWCLIDMGLMFNCLDINLIMLVGVKIVKMIVSMLILVRYYVLKLLKIF